MLEGYIKNKFEIIEQIDKNSPIQYNYDYSNYYNKLGELSNYMSYLRYGYLKGVINEQINSILDIGYGNGSFLKICGFDNKKCYGYDVSEYPLNYGIKLDNINNKYFDVITFFDSLEHFTNFDILSKINCSYIMISVPECHYLDDEWFLNWKHRKPNEHFYHFNKKSLQNLLLFYNYKCLSFSNIEDIIRKSNDNMSNILTGIFKKHK